jgi:hypothetical protein
MSLTSGVENRDPRITKIIVKIYAHFHPEYFPPGMSLDFLETCDIDPIRPQLIDFLETNVGAIRSGALPLLALGLVGYWRRAE